MKRSKHSLNNYKLLTCDMGKLVPVGLTEVLPGDSIQHHTAALIRVSPLVAPVMHPVIVRFHHWFVPNRLTWEGWEDFITGGPDGLGGSAGAYPVINSGPTGFAAASVPDYLGVPPAAINTPINAMPIRAYNLVYNEFYRDQDLVTERGIDDTTVAPVAWQKDYFTSARPWPQKGPEVSMPLGASAPVLPTGGQPSWHSAAEPLSARSLQATGGSADVNWSSVPGASGVMSWHDPALVADLSSASAVGVNDVRRAFAIQRYQEARAQYGSRYTEYLRYLGVRSSDARLQRPEYLGGGKQTIAFSEVLRTGNTDSTVDGPIGELSGHGIAAMRSRRYRRFFEEHGFVVSIMSVRPKTIYEQGINRLWSRRAKEDYWQKELELIGQQEVLNREVFADGSAADAEVFGYQDRYSEYRHTPSDVCGEFRTTFDYWHMARMFAARPTLNASFVNCDATKRIHAEQTQHSLWCMINNSVSARRMVGKRTIGRII